MAELRTTISLDSSAAEQGVDQLMQKAQAVRAKEYADQQKLVQDLASMSVDEFDRQIEAQGRLLEKLRIKQEAMGDEERVRIVQEYAERKKVFEDSIKDLDEEANKIAQLHAQRVQELEELRRLDGPDEMEQRKAREIELENEIGKIVSESRDNYIARTEEAYQMEEDRLKTLQELASQGGDDAVTGGGFGDKLKGLPGQLEQVMAFAQRAMSPLLKILGPVGIAFSLEQVVEKLYKANEELRVIRNNYAEIAASMGELARVGEGVYIGASTAALMSLQREFTLQYGGGIDPKLIPQTASTLMVQGGMAGEDPEVLRKVVEETARIGVVVGNSQEVAQVGARLYREFNVAVEDVSSELALLKTAAEEAHMPFSELARNTLMLAEQTRVYGFDIDDSRRLVKEFSHELHTGTLTMQDLIQVQRATADMPEQQRLGLIAYMDRLSDIVGELPGGGNLEQLFGMVGGPEAQGAFMQFIQQGQVPTPEMELLRSLPANDPQRQAFGTFFNMESGKILPDMVGVGGLIKEAAIQLVDALALEMSEGSVGRQRVLREQLMRMFTPEMAGRPIAVEEAMRGVGEVAGRDMGVERGLLMAAEDKVQQTRESSLAELVKISDELLKNRQGFADGIKSGMKIWWQDAVTDINTFFQRQMGFRSEKLLADWDRIPEGGAFMEATRGVLGAGVDIFDPGKISFQQLTEISKQVDVLSDGDTRQAEKYMEDFVRMLVRQGALGSRPTIWDVENIVEQVTSAGRGQSRRGLSPEEQLSAMEDIYSRRYRKRVEHDIEWLGKQKGEVIDIDTTKPGLQVHLGGVSVTVISSTDKVSREDLRNALNENQELIINMVIDAANDPNNGGR